MFPHAILSALGVAFVLLATVSSLQPSRERRVSRQIEQGGSTT